MTPKPLKVLVVDDTVLYRKVISDILSLFPGVEVVGTAANGEIALAKIAELTPDLITLDQEMPVMDGLTTLRRLRERRSEVVVVMVSAHTRQGAAVTLEALNLGAYDFITKPEESDPVRSREILTAKFRPILNAVLAQKILRQTIRSMASESHPLSAVAPRAALAHPMPAAIPGAIEIIAIGISTGGPNALTDLLPRLPGNLRVPIVIVQHMPKLFTRALADSLDAKCAIRVVEGANGMPLEAATAYIAPGGHQMRVDCRQGRPGYYLEVNNDPSENHCQPAADYLFRSVARAFKGQALGIIMTGMGCDGTLGLRLMKRQGAQVIAQDQATSVVYGMPMEAVRAGVVDVVLPLSEIAAEIKRRVG